MTPLPTVYIETSIVSYLTARPSRDLIVAVHQQLTREWWDRRRSSFHLVTSQAVSDEASAGDPKATMDRLASLNEIPLLQPTPETASLAQSFIGRGLMPVKAAADAGHVALAAVHGVDYLLTWYCRHMANAEIRRALARVCSERGWRLPTICTPQELSGSR